MITISNTPKCGIEKRDHVISIGFRIQDLQPNLFQLNKVTLIDPLLAGHDICQLAHYNIVNIEAHTSQINKSEQI